MVLVFFGAGNPPLRQIFWLILGFVHHRHNLQNPSLLFAFNRHHGLRASERSAAGSRKKTPVPQNWRWTRQARSGDG
jgi:hypothetical protein